MSMRKRIYRELRGDWKPISIIVAIFVAIILFVPFFPETDIHVRISSDGLYVWVDAPYKPLVFRFLSSSYPRGDYTLNGNVTINGLLITSFSLVNVSFGEYVLVWQSFGKPSSGYYGIIVQLYTFPLSQSAVDYMITSAHF